MSDKENDDVIEFNDCSVCGESIGLYDGCEWPDDIPVCWECLYDQRAKLEADIEALKKFIFDHITNKEPK